MESFGRDGSDPPSMREGYPRTAPADRQFADKFAPRSLPQAHPVQSSARCLEVVQ
jgi:hypothetical protein